MNKKLLIIFFILLVLVVALSGWLFLGRTDSPKEILKNLPIVQQVLPSPINQTPKSGKLVSSTFERTFTKTAISSSNSSFYGSNSLPANYDVDKYNVIYESLDAENNTLQIHAQLFIPKAATGQELPLYIFGQGTTGLGDHCAPSNEQPQIENWGNYPAHMLSYASQGFIVMFPDYEGFNDPTRIHHYFNAQLEAHVLLDGARATYAFFNEENLPVTPEQSVFFAGYSQGGHAAFAVSDIAGTYAPDVPTKGVMSYGGTTDIPNLLKENPALSPYLVYAYSDYYGENRVNPSQILRPELLSNLEQTVTSTCIGKIYQAYSSSQGQIFNSQFLEALNGNTLESDFPELAKVFTENSTGLKQNPIPALVLQGSTDPIVTVASTQEFLTKVCALGNSVTYLEYPGVHHYQTRQVSFSDSITWMNQIRNGQTPQKYC